MPGSSDSQVYAEELRPSPVRRPFEPWRDTNGRFHIHQGYVEFVPAKYGTKLLREMDPLPPLAEGTQIVLEANVRWNPKALNFRRVDPNPPHEEIDDVLYYKDGRYKDVAAAVRLYASSEDVPPSATYPPQQTDSGTLEQLERHIFLLATIEAEGEISHEIFNQRNYLISGLFEIQKF